MDKLKVLLTKEVEEELSQRRALIKTTCKKYGSENYVKENLVRAVFKSALKLELCSKFLSGMVMLSKSH